LQVAKKILNEQSPRMAMEVLTGSDWVGASIVMSEHVSASQSTEWLRSLSVQALEAIRNAMSIVDIVFHWRMPHVFTKLKDSKKND